MGSSIFILLLFPCPPRWAVWLLVDPHQGLASPEILAGWEGRSRKSNWSWELTLNTLRQRQTGWFLADDVFKCIFLSENVWISLKISLKFVPKVWINNMPSLVQIMAWRWPGDKPVSETMMVSLPMHICVTYPKWFNTLSSKQNG